MERRGARQAPPQPLRLLLALGHLEGIRRRRPCRAERPATRPDGHYLLHNRGRLPERPRLSEDARRPAGRGGRNLGDQLLAGRPSTAHSQPHLSRRSAAGVHRHGPAQEPDGVSPACAGSLSQPRRQNPWGQIRRLRRHFPRRRRLGCVPRPAARAVSAQGVRCLGRLCAFRGHLHVQRRRSDAGQSVGDCPGQAIARSTLGCFAARARRLQKGGTFSPSSCEWEAR